MRTIAVSECIVGTAAGWEASTVVIGFGLMVLTTDTMDLKIGDGVNVYKDLPVKMNLNDLASIGHTHGPDDVGLSHLNNFGIADSETILDESNTTTYITYPMAYEICRLCLTAIMDNDTLTEEQTIASYTDVLNVMNDIDTMLIEHYNDIIKPGKLSGSLSSTATDTFATTVAGYTVSALLTAAQSDVTTATQSYNALKGSLINYIHPDNLIGVTDTGMILPLSLLTPLKNNQVAMQSQYDNISSTNSGLIDTLENSIPVGNVGGPGIDNSVSSLVVGVSVGIKTAYDKVTAYASRISTVNDIVSAATPSSSDFVSEDAIVLQKINLVGDDFSEVLTGVKIKKDDVYIDIGSLVGATFIITENTANINIESLLIANDINPTVSGHITLHINPGVVVGSSTATSPAVIIPATINSRSSVMIINDGSIIGAGGAGGYGPQHTNDQRAIRAGQAGGTAIVTSVPTVIINNGLIAGGGGGGGPGGGWWSSGSGGGGGAGSVPGNGGSRGSGGGTSGTIGTLMNGGSGGPGFGGDGGPGGRGGNLGEAGVSGSSPGWGPYTPGAAGAAVSGNSHVTWSVTGDVRGPLI